MVYITLTLASVALLLALAALRASIGASSRLDRVEADARRAYVTADEASEHTRRLEMLVSRLAAGEAVTREMILEGRLFSEISSEDARRLIEDERPEDLFVLDVRTRGEVEGGHIAGAAWVPVDELQERFREIPSRKHVVVVCAMGSRSAAACEFLSTRGYGRLTNVAGGMTSYGGATVTGTPGSATS